MNYIKPFNEVGEGEVELVGGKGLSLGRLAQAGFPIPPGFVITTDAYKAFGDKEIDSELKQAIFKAFDKLDAERVAVRSSAIAEDSPNASWAGQFESYLNVGRQQLIDSVIKCWESASSEMVNAYAESKSTNKEQLAIAVVIQKMVDSEVSGVAFSVNPITKNNNEIMIEAIYGLGEFLVQGMVTPDNYVVDKKELNIIEKNTKTKPNMLIYRDGDNVEEKVPESQQAESCLSDDQIGELSQIITKIEQFYGKPQDVEWALGGGQFYIVQSRPITTI